MFYIWLVFLELLRWPLSLSRWRAHARKREHSPSNSGLNSICFSSIASLHFFFCWFDIIPLLLHCITTRPLAVHFIHTWIEWKTCGPHYLVENSSWNAVGTAVVTSTMIINMCERSPQSRSSQIDTFNVYIASLLCIKAKILISRILSYFLYFFPPRNCYKYFLSF